MARGVNRNWLNAAGHPHAGLAQDRQRGDAASGQMNDCTAPLSEQRWRQASCIERAAAASYHRRMTIAVKIMGMLVSFVARLVTGAQGHWKGCPPEALQRIYFANHQSHLDWVLIWAALPDDLRVRTRPIAARDYWTANPFKHWLTREVFNAVYVSRQRSADQDPLEPLAEALQLGDSLVIFPEGTRSSKGEPLPFKSGLYHLSLIHI